MSDWFKFYNDALDSKGMQFAISEQPLVTSVWLLLLSEASKNRSSKFPWSDKDFELFGFARKINISAAIFNQCLGLLERIEYLSKNDGNIEIQGWDKLQSDYARGLDKGYYKKTKKKLASNSEVSTVRVEDRREDEIRVEKKEGKESFPALTEVFKECEMRGYPKSSGESFWNHYESIGWVGSNSLPLTKWQPRLANWVTKDRSDKSKGTYNGNGKAHSLNPAAERRNAGTIGGTDYGAAGKRLLARQAAELAGTPITDESKPPST